MLTVMPSEDASVTHCTQFASAPHWVGCPRHERGNRGGNRRGADAARDEQAPKARGDHAPVDLLAPLGQPRRPGGYARVHRLDAERVRQYPLALDPYRAYKPGRRTFDLQPETMRVEPPSLGTTCRARTAQIAP